MSVGVRLIDELEELVPLLDLRDIRFLEISARAITDGSEEPSPVQINAGAGRQDEGDRDLVTRMGASLVDEHGVYRVEVVGLYVVPDNVEISSEVEDAFLTEIAVFSLYPYVREGLASSAAQLRLPTPTLALLKRGSGAWTKSDDSYKEL